ncbi:VOC family protein [Zemynaea arenosa]|nr:VOC family protein [Massilia arenosa]
MEHIPVAVQDLETAQARFRALGFTLKPGRPNANGIRNAHAKFQDGSYLELITAPHAVDELTAAYRQHLERGDGPAYLSLYVSTLEGLATRLADLGARSDEGTVTFPPGPLEPFFFGTRAPSPTDKPEYVEHPNGALGVDRVWLAPSDSAPVERMLVRLGAQLMPTQVCLPACTTARTAHVAQGDLVILPATAQQVRGRAILGAAIRVMSLDRVRAVLQRSGIPIGPDGALDRGDSLLLPPPLANGMWLEFHTTRAE